MDNSRQKKFVDEYNKLIDALSSVNQSRLFWATDFASKNRIGCPLPDFLERGEIDAHIPNVKYKRMAGVFYHAFRLAVRMLKARAFLKRLDNSKPCTVIKTFVYPHSFKNGKYEDVFMGRLPGHLASQKNVVIYAHILGDYDTCLRLASTSDRVIIPVEAMLSFKDFVQAVIDILFVPIVVPSSLTFDGKDVSPLIRKYFNHTFKGVQLEQYVQFWAARKLALSLQIETFYMTYENYPWERMVIKALHDVSPATEIVGIQHTVVPEAFLNYFVSHAEKMERLLPDRAYTTGVRPAEIIKRYSSDNALSIKPGCGLRFESFQGIEISGPRRPLQNILMPLEASLKAAPMVAYVLKQMAQQEGLVLRVRNHPLLPWERFEQVVGMKPGQNVQFSKGSLKEDLEWADVVIYWSTTVAMEALMMGKPVIHFDTGALLSFDPLFECDSLKLKVTENQSLMDVISKLESLSEETFEMQGRKAREYLGAYFSPVSEENLRQIA
jgi:hypothetical protein